ncbi:MAG: DUF4249 domain-containing protein [Bacteroidota bacterium]
MNRIIVFLVFLLLSCVEEVDVIIGTSEEAQNVLVVQAMLTDEANFQEVLLSRLDTITDLTVDSIFNPFVPDRMIDRDLVSWEANATVTIEDSNGTTFDFVEAEAGRYLSVNQFAAQTGIGYRLRIRTSVGAEFLSDEMQIEGEATIANIAAEPTISETGVEGVGIVVDNQNIQGNSGNLRFTYDETYKIVAPQWVEREYLLTEYDPCALPVVTYNLERIPREEEAQVCFRTESSNTVILNDIGIGDTDLERFRVRFISKENYIIANRYSIEVQQLVTSPEAFGFYEQLRNFSQNESLFSAVQPGFLEGNITALNSGSAIGFFEVASISRARFFFNFDEVFPGEPLPDYPIDCSLRSSPESHVSFCLPTTVGNVCPQSVIEQVNLDLITYVGRNDNEIGVCPGPDVYVSKPCGDCRVWGSNVVPEFWIEE